MDISNNTLKGGASACPEKAEVSPASARDTYLGKEVVWSQWSKYGWVPYEVLRETNTLLIVASRPLGLEQPGEEWRVPKAPLLESGTATTCAKEFQSRDPWAGEKYAFRDRGFLSLWEFNQQAEGGES
jgi:hypothetical protein